MEDKTRRLAKSIVREAHTVFHQTVGHSRKDYNHKPGYDDGVAATLLARIQQIEDRLIAVEGLIRTRLPRVKISRKLTAWQVHAGNVLRQGGSMRDAAATWKKRV